MPAMLDARCPPPEARRCGTAARSACQRAGQVHADEPGPLVVAVAVERLGRAEARAVDQDGQPAETLGRGVDGGGDRGGVGHVGLPARVGRPRVEVEVHHADDGAVGRQPVGDGPADPPGAAGDERAPPGQRAGHQNPWNHWPAFTPRAWPVMGLDMSEAKNTTASAISAEVGR